MKSIGIFLGIEPYAGGMFQYSESLLNALKLMHEKNYDISVAYVSSSWKQVLTSYPFKTKQLVGGKFGLLLSELILLLRFPIVLSRLFSAMFNPISIQLSQLRCDFWIFPSQDTIAYQSKLKVVAAIHDLMHRYEPSFPEVSNNGRLLMRERRLGNLALCSHAILVDSEMGRQHVIDSYGVNPGKIFPLPYVPPTHIFYENSKGDFDKRYILPKKYILYPAQFWEHKNHKRLIKAAFNISSQEPDISLVFMGGKNKDYGNIKSYAHELRMESRIIFTGYVPDDDVVGFYKRARAMIMPTFFGPTNIPPLEAFACGCPVAVSNIYGMPEQVEDAALLFDPSSVDEISSVMTKLWTDDSLCQQLVDKGYNKSRKWGQKQFAELFYNTLFRADLL